MDKKRKHALCEKNAIFGIIAAVLFVYFTIAIGGMIGHYGFNSDTVNYILEIVFALIALIILSLWFKPEFKGFAKPCVTLKEAFMLCVPGLLITVLAFVLTAISAGYVYFNPTFNALMMAITAGVFEEALFRAAPVALGMRYLKNENRSFYIAVIVSVCFGLTHFANAASGADFVATIFQVIASAGTGLFLIAIFLRTGSIIPPMLIHGIYDWVCFVGDPTLTEDGLVTNADNPMNYVFGLAIGVLFGIVGFYMLRKVKRAEINKIWDQKWSR